MGMKRFLTFRISTGGFRISNLKCEICTLQSAICHLKSAVCNLKSAILLPCLVALIPGCIADNTSRPLEQRVTYVPRENAEPAFFLSRPAVASVSGKDFDTLWNAIYRVTRNAGFVA